MRREMFCVDCGASIGMQNSPTPRLRCDACRKIFKKQYAYNYHLENGDIIRRRAADWLVNNRERANARSAKWHAENREEQNARRKARALEKADEERIAKAACYAKNRERRIAAVNRYRMANTGKVNASIRNRKARVRGAPGKHTSEEVLNLLIKQDHKCANPHCRADLRVVKKHLDHKQPIARGGSN